jgi:hypothetical protein
MNMHELFDEVRKKNESMGAEQNIKPPIDVEHLPTLGGGHRALSPMLRELFSYCSYWENFILFQDLLSADERLKIGQSDEYLGYFESCALAWDKTPHAKYDKSRLTVLGYSFDMVSDTLLIWPHEESGIVEPKVFFMDNNRPFAGDNLRRFLEYYVDLRENDDSGFYPETP